MIRPKLGRVHDGISISLNFEFQVRYFRMYIPDKPPIKILIYIYIYVYIDICVHS